MLIAFTRRDFPGNKAISFFEYGKVGSIKMKRHPSKRKQTSCWFYCILFGLFALLSFGLFLLAVYSGSDHPIPEDLETVPVYFDHYEIKQMRKSISTELLLYTQSNPKPISLSFYEGYQEWIPDPWLLCDGRQYEAGVCEGKAVYSLYTLAAPDGQIILSYSDYQKGYQNSQGTAIVLLKVISILGTLYFLGGVIFALNPKKYPKWVCKLYFEKGKLWR